MKRLLLLLPLVLSFLAGPAFAQGASTTVATDDNAELGTILTDSEGMTLYVFTKDEPGTSNCNDECATNWPPLTSEDALTLPDDLTGELSLIDRADGTQQVAYNRWPLYYFAGDKAAGDTNGQKVGDVWFVVNAPTVKTSEDAALGTILTDSKGMTLYMFSNDAKDTSNCNDECATNWPPLTAEKPVTLPKGVSGKLTVIDRADGTHQVAYNGIPLYYFAGDKAAGDTNGQEVGDVWFVVNPEVSDETPNADDVTPEPTEEPGY